MFKEKDLFTFQIMHLLTDTRFVYNTIQYIYNYVFKKNLLDKHIFINYVYQNTLCTVQNTDLFTLVYYFLTNHLYD